MAGTLTLTVGATVVTLSHLADIQPNYDIETGTVIKKSKKFGTIFAYASYSAKVNHRLEFNNVPKVSADYVNSWAYNKNTVIYCPDTTVSSTVYNVKIINDGNPFNWMPGTSPDSVFQGSLMLREV